MSDVATTPTGMSAYLARAVELGREGMLEHRGGPFGAVVVGPDGEIVGEGCNSVTSSNDPTAHAEVSAIRDACRRLQTFVLHGCTLYTSCEPCPMCLAAAYWARVDEIVFGATREDAARAGFDDAFIYDEIPLPPAERHLPMRSDGRQQAAALFDEWLDLEGRTPY
jgi:tRNA(Arg) A34 adenosine deaminase TadA